MTATDPSADDRRDPQAAGQLAADLRERGLDLAQLQARINAASDTKGVLPLTDEHLQEIESIRTAISEIQDARNPRCRHPRPHPRGTAGRQPALDLRADRQGHQTEQGPNRTDSATAPTGVDAVVWLASSRTYPVRRTRSLFPRK
jgi:hypothetical protein